MSTWKPARPPRHQIEPRRVGESLDRVTRAIGAPKAGTLGTIFERWDAIVGAEIASHAVPRSLRDGVLAVAVDQPAWARQLGFMSAELLAKITEFVGVGEVTEIRFRVGK